MQFKDLKPGSSIYLLDKSSLTLTEGKVLQNTLPYPDRRNNNSSYTAATYTTNNHRMVVDITLEANGNQATYTVSENGTVNYSGDLALSVDKQSLTAEVESLVSYNQQIVDNYELAKENLKKANILRSELNPVFKQQLEYDNRLNKMEKSVGRMEELLNNFINEFKK